MRCVGWKWASGLAAGQTESGMLGALDSKSEYVAKGPGCPDAVWYSIFVILGSSFHSTQIRVYSSSHSEARMGYGIGSEGARLWFGAPWPQRMERHAGDRWFVRAKSETARCRMASSCDRPFPGNEEPTRS